MGILDFSDIIRHIETSTCQANTPPWLSNIINSGIENKYKYRGGHYNNQSSTHLPDITNQGTPALGNGRNNQRGSGYMNRNCGSKGGGNSENGDRVVNDNLSDSQMINTNGLFRNVFHPRIKDQYRGQRPKYDGGENCHKYHGIGVYNTT